MLEVLYTTAHPANRIIAALNQIPKLNPNRTEQRMAASATNPPTANPAAKKEKSFLVSKTNAVRPVKAANVMIVA